MECNKEEATRAKGIAENKMQNGDFSGARKIALRAHKLYNDLDNISQMLRVCDVHCAAEQRLFGNEMDWYGILQIEQTVGEAAIKKQYRKFAFLLHPDKNKFPGAEAAFKLIGDAQRVLLDKGKRSLHDMKYRASVSKPADFTGMNSQHKQPQQQPQPGFSNVSPTFWTMCPFCPARYHFYRELIQKSLRCKKCRKPFIAHESYGPEIPTATNLSQAALLQKRNYPNQGACKAEQGCQENVPAGNSRAEFYPQTGCASNTGAEKANGKRARKQVAGSTESYGTESSSDSEEDMVVEENGDIQAEENIGSHGVQCPRRSERHNLQVSYNENIADDDESLSQPKRAKGNGSSRATEEESGNVLKEEVLTTNKQSGLAAVVKTNQKTAKLKEPVCITNDHKESSDASADSLSESSSKDSEMYSYPDPDFKDFDKDRREECFKVGQTWAVYDVFDAMPRFYVRIKNVLSPGFKLRITWLEPDPDKENEIEWVNEGLPASCGKFKHGLSENTENRLMFSHLIPWEKGSCGDACKIFPRKGETWALFRNWNIRWSTDADANRKFGYEFVVILSEYAEDVGTSVAYLAKIKGFASLFSRIVREGEKKYQIPPDELFRFSHRVLSFELTGNEREGVPKGSFELDPASLPANIEEIDAPLDLKFEAGMQPSGSCSRLSDNGKPMMQSEGSASTKQAGVKETHRDHEDYIYDDKLEDQSSPLALDPDNIELPETEFFNFDAVKSQEKFQIGQFWSLYCDEDTLPKYYCQIYKIESGPGFKLHIRWLVPCPRQKNMIRWIDKSMPFCCGRFKIMNGVKIYTSTAPFSHPLRAEPVGKNGEYAIFPRKGEIWALYRNWKADIKCSDLENCEYDIVEVLDETDMWIDCLVLESVDGFKSVFKVQLKGGRVVTIEVPRVELLRFSHQIPTFRLTGERGGSLRGFLELDSAAVPVQYLLS
ncbi:DnaJ domain-containing protein/DUF3444 domain-containing protein [Cephalotus follicularis]|uniref:DnaJ domain-containing protein/DUF3444 domain-containing protein n=1 Tax=Cephalotus follicularis TaxID=3775 RepID=A0A1Q3B5W1_CEPFO|nr:DnaJ domain-containing protein/DUF3444 domain-containing protein [Cephalotus follicularis]